MGTALLGELDGRVKIPLGVGVMVGVIPLGVRVMEEAAEGPLRVDVGKVGRLGTWSPPPLPEGSEADSLVRTDEELGRVIESFGEKGEGEGEGKGEEERGGGREGGREGE